MRKRFIFAILAALLAIAAISILIFGGDSIGDLIARAEALRDEGEIERAADLFWQAALMEPESPRAAEALYEAGYTYYVVGKPREEDARRGKEMAIAARQAFTRLIERYPDSDQVAPARLELGKIYSEDGEYKKALEQYEAVVGVIEDVEQRQTVCLEMAECYEQLGQIEFAIARLTDIIHLGRGGGIYETAHLILARYYYEAGMNERAVEQLERLLSGPVSFYTRQEAFTRLATSLLELNMFSQAEEALANVEVNSSNRAKVEDLRTRIARRSSPER